MSKNEPKHPSKTPSSDVQSTGKGSDQLNERELAQVTGGTGTHSAGGGGGAGKA